MRKLILLFVMAFAIHARIIPDDDTTALRTVAQSTLIFANNFLKKVADTNSTNLITSSLSAQLALAMTAYGARNKTATEMRSALQIPDDDELGQSGYQSLIQTLNDIKSVNLSIANKMYSASDFKTYEEYKRLIREKFLSSIEEVDFNDPECAANIINSWCAQQTNNLIDDLISPDSITGDTKLALVNAVYFKGQWAKKFDPKSTHDALFNVDENTAKDVPTMYVGHDFRMNEVPELNAKLLEIPYEGNEISMVIILPDEQDGLGTVLENLDNFNLTESLRGAIKLNVALLLPKFKIETELDLQLILEEMGMTDMFENGADFSGISNTPLKVDKVVQKAFIEVNEEGTEAAAATAVLIVNRTGSESILFRVDRPFYYVIYHRNTNVALFSGYIRDPTAG